MSLVSLTIDNAKVQIEAGSTVLEAAKKAGIKTGLPSSRWPFLRSARGDPTSRSSWGTRSDGRGRERSARTR